MLTRKGPAQAMTPELIDRARRLAARVDARADDLPKRLNRMVLVLLPKARFFVWSNAWAANLKGGAPMSGTDEERWMHARTYLLPYIETPEAIDRFVAEHRQYFLDSYVMGHAPRSRWPWEPDAEEFDAWFECRLATWGPWDLSTEPLEASPDEMLAMGEILAAGPDGAEDPVI